MAVAAPKIRAKDDGHVLIWWRGWELEFPPGVGRPTLERREPPAEARKAGREVKVGPRWLIYRKWLVYWLDPSGKARPRVGRSAPSALGGLVRRYKTRLRRLR